MADSNAHKYAPARLARIWNVSEFAKRFKLGRFEENRLLRLMGPTATERQLLLHANRRPL